MKEPDKIIVRCIHCESESDLENPCMDVDAKSFEKQWCDVCGKYTLYIVDWNNWDGMCVYARMKMDEMEAM